MEFKKKIYLEKKFMVLFPWNSSSIKWIFVLLMLVMTMGPTMGPWSVVFANELSYDDFTTKSKYTKTKDLPQTTKDWTVLIFMEGENDLSTYALKDLYEMEAPFASRPWRAGSTSKINIVAQINTRQDNHLRRLLIKEKSNLNVSSHEEVQPVQTNDHPSNLKFFDLQKIISFDPFDWSSSSSEVLQILSDEKFKNQGELLNDFLNWGIQKFPAKNYWVIFWGHGAGWKEGFGFNEKLKTSLSLQDLKSSLESTSRLINKPITLLSFDACFMQNLEMLYELSPFATYITGTNQTQSYLGLPYRRLFYEINTGHYLGYSKLMAQDHPLSVALMVPELIQQGLDPHSGLQGRLDSESQNWFTASSVQSNELQNIFLPQFEILISKLKKYFQLFPDEKIKFLSLLEKYPQFQNHNIDVGFVFKAMTQLPRVDYFRTELNQTQEALNRALLKTTSGVQNRVDPMSNIFVANPSGISIWFPLDEDSFKKDVNSYFKTQIHRHTAWGLFLEELYKL